MKAQEIEIFRQRFASIVYVQSEIKQSEERLKNLHRWDKNDSHRAAILKELDARNALREKLAAKLGPNTYDEWKAFSKKLSRLVTRRTTATRNLLNAESEIQELTF